MSDTRQALRQKLLQARQVWSGSDSAQTAQAELAAHLAPLLAELEPQCLGLYWPIRGEFNPQGVALALCEQMTPPPDLALPWASKGPSKAMSYRHWDGAPPTDQDECGIPCSTGRPVQPDVLLVPCVGFTRSGLRLGYGGGYFDRYMAAHPHVTAIGLAWSEAELSDAQLPAQAHDQALMIIVTPEGVVS
jgi:5-formyltetrahydrofolate cyclo-ligase